MHPATSTATVQILDDDGPGILSLRCRSCGDKGGRQIPQFAPKAGAQIEGFDGGCRVLQRAQTVVFAVARSYGSRGGVAVRFSVESVSAVAGIDFNETTGVLLWDDRCVL